MDKIIDLHDEKEITLTPDHITMIGRLGLLFNDFNLHNTAINEWTFIDEKNFEFLIVDFGAKVIEFQKGAVFTNERFYAVCGIARILDFEVMAD